VGTSASIDTSNPTASASAVPTIARAVRRRPPALAGPVQVPGAVHAQVRAERPVADAHEDVLAAGHHGVHHRSGEIGVGELRHPQIEPRDRAAPQRVVEARGRAVDGVAPQAPAPPRSRRDPRPRRDR
jgi:hypothetical protein